MSAERQARVNNTIRGGKERSEKYEKMVQINNEKKIAKEQKRRAKETNMLQCLSALSPEVEIPQTDGPIDTPVASSHGNEHVASDTVEDVEDANNENCSDKDCQAKYHVRNYIDTTDISDDRLKPAYIKCSDCGAEGANIDWSAHRGNPVYKSGAIQDNICLDCPLFPSTWCNSDHTECPTLLDQVYERGLEGKMCTIHACQVCGLVGLHSCTDNGQYKSL